MRRLHAGGCVALLLASALTGCESGRKASEKPQGDPGQMRAVAEGANAFALDLYAKLREREGNLFLSPFSIATALAMAQGGARGETASQLRSALHLPMDDALAHTNCGALLRELTSPGDEAGYQLHIANALWGQQGYPFLEDYLALVRTHYGAGLSEVDFQGATEAARTTINAWIEEHTGGKIRDLIPPGGVQALTRLVLTNAIYFKGDWQWQFQESRTRDEPFTLLDGTKVDAPMMRQKALFRCVHIRDFQVLELPYAGEALSMIALLPVRDDGLPAFEKTLSAETLAEWLGELREQEATVILPRFQMTSTFALGETLRALGITDAFSEEAADFSGMGREPGLFLNDVLHKAYVEVNEEGSEAAAATAVAKDMAIEGRPPPREFEFRADHPFLFLIRDNRYGAILFLGRVMNPQES